MQQSCVNCRGNFSVEKDELDFLERVSPVIGGKVCVIPPSTLCPDCRLQRRFAQRNERFLHRRTCDLTGKTLISFYRPDSPYKAYEKDAWWSDGWDAMEYGRPFDFSRSFFEQFAALRKVVPRLGMVATRAEGDAYSAYCVSTKHCYMCISCVVNEDSYYCYQANDSRNCVDCNNVTQCELCYECLHCLGLFSSAFCKDCENGSGLLFCEDCRGCSDCIGCKNLVNKKHCILNQQATEAEVLALRKLLGSYAALRKFRADFHARVLTMPTRSAHLIQCENCTGDHLRQCRNCSACFDSTNLEDCHSIFPTPTAGAKDCRDLHYSPGAELVYDSVSAVRTYGSRFVLHTWDTADATYTDECFSGKHLFGCAGLKHQEYCILNKQYTQAEYEELVPKVIAHMRSTEEWGDFFPIQDSPFAYNETIAQDEFPLTKEAVTAAGWNWGDLSEEPPNVARTIPADKLPDTIGDIPDEVVHWAVESEESGRPFKIIKQELDFYRSMNLPLPRLHPEERYRERLKLRNPRKLWKRSCAKCGKGIETSYAPERPEIVYCESCYLKEVY